ncbi:MAG: hypothetical protein AABX55_01150 [Nanoarchaeota archaeon]|mgnify:CR=1 FL=1
MGNLRFLQKKEVERFLKKIKDQYGIENLNLDHNFLQNKEGKIFIISKDIKKVNLSKLRINNLGLYIARLDKELRLTIEGSQLIGKYARKNIYEVNEQEANSWMQGKELGCEKEFKGFVIIKHNNDYLGSGKYKDNKILNFIPRERWIK